MVHSNSKDFEPPIKASENDIPEATADQLEMLNELKRLARNENPQFDSSKKFHSDLTLFSYIKKYRDPVVAFESWKETLLWREEFGVDTILEVHKSMLNLTRPYPRQIHKTDKLGRPIGITRISLIDFDLVEGKEEEFLRDLVQEHERTRTTRLDSCTRAQGKLVYQFLNILDLNGATFSSLSKGYQLTASVNNIVQKHFPDAMGKMFIINTPWIFYQIWSVAKKLLLEERIIEKIQVLGHDYKAELLKVIDEKNLPNYLGGSCKCKDGCENVYDIGPWTPASYESQSDNSSSIIEDASEYEELD